MTIVVPVRDEAESVPLFMKRLAEVLQTSRVSAEILFVDDGSRDGTVQAIESLRARDERIACLELSRNFGKEIALTAGLHYAAGDAVVMIDADLQDPPELIPRFVQLWREGYDVVYGTRTDRSADSRAKRVTANLFYRMAEVTSEIRIPRDAGDFRLLSRRAVKAVLALPEQHRFMKGLFAWIGFSQIAVPYARAPRAGGRTKFSYWRLWNFAIEGITSFSTAPLRLATYLGLSIALLSLAYAGVVVIKTLLYGDPVAGYPSLMTVILFLGGVQLMTIGVLGEYVGRIFNETKRRPLFLVSRYVPSGPAVAVGAGDGSDARSMHVTGSVHPSPSQELNRPDS
jgi:glycosyltransferase involved in cell wall biosynthesis